MKKQLLIAGLMSIVSFCFAQKAPKEVYNPNKKISPQQLKEDVVFLRKCLEEGHPSLYRYVSKDSFARAHNNFVKTLTDSLTEREFRNKLFGLVNIIGCGHSLVFSSKGREQFLADKSVNFLPFLPVMIDNRLYVDENKSKDSTLTQGTEILEIEGRKVADCLADLDVTFSRDGYNKTHSEYYLRKRFTFFYTRLFAEKEVYRLLIKDKMGVTREVDLPTFSSKTYVNKSPSKLIAPKPIFTYKKVNQFVIDSENPAIGVLRLQSFPTLKFWKFYRKVFKYARKHNLEHLVLDLRDNGGGLVFNAGHLMGYLADTPIEMDMYHKGGKPSFLPQTEGKDKAWRGTTRLFTHVPKRFGIRTVKNDTFFNINYKNKVREKNRFRGQLYVLTNGQTFSSSVIVSAYVRSKTKAIFVGEETGGAEEGSNAMVTPILILPNSKLRYRLPLFRLDHKVAAKTVGHGVIPDYPIVYDLKNYLENRDLEMEKVRELVKTRQ